MTDTHSEVVSWYILWYSVSMYIFKTQYYGRIIIKAKEFYRSQFHKLGYMVIMYKGLCITLIFAGIFQSAFSTYYSLWNNEEILIYFKVHRNRVFLKSHILFNWKMKNTVKYTSTSLCCRYLYSAYSVIYEYLYTFTTTVCDYRQSAFLFISKNNVERS